MTFLHPYRCRAHPRCDEPAPGRPLRRSGRSGHHDPAVGHRQRGDGPPVPLGTSANYSVLGASTVTNTGPSRLDRSLGLAPGPEITGFDIAVPTDGRVTAPGVIDQTNAAAAQAQLDLTAA